MRQSSSLVQASARAAELTGSWLCARVLCVVAAQPSITYQELAHSCFCTVRQARSAVSALVTAGLLLKKEGGAYVFLDGHPVRPPNIYQLTELGLACVEVPVMPQKQKQPEDAMSLAERYGLVTAHGTLVDGALVEAALPLVPEPDRTKIQNLIKGGFQK